MARTIEQTVSLPASAERLYGMYVDPAVHAAFTGAPVEIGQQPGVQFSAFDGMLQGKVLQTVPDRLVVQSWRSSNWKAEDLDSTLILTFWPEGERGRIELVHANVPDHDFRGVMQGWEKYYWTPWRNYLERAGC
jgi:activator of HSP90 ATPase